KPAPRTITGAWSSNCPSQQRTIRRRRQHSILQTLLGGYRMKLNVEEQIQRTVTVTLQERLDVVSAPQLKSALEEYMNQGVNQFVIDLSTTPFMDSAGMAVLVTLLRRCRMNGGNVKLVWPQYEPVQRTLTLTRFDRVFEVIGRN